MYPRDDDPACELNNLDGWCYEALDLPDVPPERRARIVELKKWSASHPSTFLPRFGTPACGEIFRRCREGLTYLREDERMAAVMPMPKTW